MSAGDADRMSNVTFLFWLSLVPTGGLRDRPNRECDEEVSNIAGIRLVVDHLPWLASFVNARLVSRGQRPLGRDVHVVRIRLGRDTRVGGNQGCFLAQAPTQDPFVPWGTTLPAGTVLRFSGISTGYEDPCSWLGPSAPVFVVEGGPSDGLCAAIYLDWLDEMAVAEALAITEI